MRKGSDCGWPGNTMKHKISLVRNLSFCHLIAACFARHCSASPYFFLLKIKHKVVAKINPLLVFLRQRGITPFRATFAADLSFNIVSTSWRQCSSPTLVPLYEESFHRPHIRFGSIQAPQTLANCVKNKSDYFPKLRG